MYYDAERGPKRRSGLFSVKSVIILAVLMLAAAVYLVVSGAGKEIFL